MIFGLGAALGWGFADFLAALSSRRAGSFRTLVIAQLAGSVFLTALIPLLVPQFASLSASGVLTFLGIGLALALTYLSFYRALEHGPLALVSPIAASYAAIVIVLAVVVLRESLASGSVAGIVTTLIGVILVSADFRSIPRIWSRAGPGIPYALGAMVGFGVASFLIAQQAKTHGWFLPVYFARIATTGFLLLLAVALGNRGSVRSAEGNGLRVRAALLFPAAALAVGAGMLDSIGLSFYSRGSELGFVSIVAAASATYPLVPVIAGLAFLDETLNPARVLGVALVVAGLLLLAVSG